MLDNGSYTTYQSLAQNGVLELRFRSVDGRVRMVDCYQTPPLKVSRVMERDEGDLGHIYLMETSGGMLAGDSHHYDFVLEKGVRLVCHWQSAAKIYPSVDGRISRQKISLMLEEESAFLLYPELIIPYCDARFDSHTSIIRHASSTLLWAEILAPGRLRHQERFAYHSVKIVFDVWKREGTSAEEWIIHDSFSWDRNTGDIQGIGVLDGCLYLGTMWFFSPVAKQMDERLWHEKLQRPDMKAGVTRTEADGLHFRWLAADGLVLKQQMERVWHQLKEMVSATHQF